MTGFERASLALIYNLYFTRKIHSSGPEIVGKRFVVETYDEDGKFRKKRYFVVRKLTQASIDIASEEGNQYKVYNGKPIIKHETEIFTEERPKEKVIVYPMNSRYVTGVGGGYNFIMEEYAYDKVRIKDDEHNSRSFEYKIVE